LRQHRGIRPLRVEELPADEGLSGSSRYLDQLGRQSHSLAGCCGTPGNLLTGQ
jgi:hypothetical protein